MPARVGNGDHRGDTENIHKLTVPNNRQGEMG